MAFPQLAHSIAGEWTGTMSLYRSSLGDLRGIQHSDSKLSVDGSWFDGFATLQYTWGCDGEDHQGAMILVSDSQTVTAGWVDSCHQENRLMSLSGGDKVPLILTGSRVGDDQADFRFELLFDGKELNIQMLNGRFGGEMHLIARARYARRP